MNRQYRAFLNVVGNGRSEAEAAKALGVSQMTVSRDLRALEDKYPGLNVLRAVCRQIHERERGPLFGSACPCSHK